MTSFSELSLDCKPVHNYTALLKSFAEQSDQTQKLEEFLSRLEEERLKIDAFKRELPLCMQLLTNAVEASRQQLQTYRSTNIEGPKPVLEEFIPLKNSNSEGSEKTTANISDNKANWMTSAQLWSQAGEELTKQQTTNINETDISLNVSCPKLGLDNKQRNGDAFIPFSKDCNSCPSPSLRSLPELALVSIDENLQDKNCSENDNGVSCQRRSENPNKIEQGKQNGNNVSEEQTNNNNSTNNTNRKARRCWSPDLHRRFVNALQMLGGSQVATPKQIRELMKVDGLTNDEVKSHLQKYRLHTRRSSPNPPITGGSAPQLVVLGGIWVPPEYATTHTSAPTALYVPPHPTVASHAPPHYCMTPVPPNFYSPPPPPPPPHSLHHQFHHLYKTTSHTQSLPESNFPGIIGGDQSESIEDGKSDSISWKGENDENGRERKGFTILRDDGEESNKSEIALKF